MTTQYRNIVELSGTVVKMIQGVHMTQNRTDGYVTFLQDDCVEEGSCYTPAKCLIMYIPNAENARLMAQEFLKLAEALEKV